MFFGILFLLFCFLLFGFFYSDLWEQFIVLMIRRKQFNFLNNSAGEVILEYKKTGGVLVSERARVPTESAMFPNSLLAKSLHQTARGALPPGPEPP